MFDKIIEWAALTLIAAIVCPIALCSILLCIEIVEVFIARFN